MGWRNEGGTISFTGWHAWAVWVATVLCLALVGYFFGDPWPCFEDSSNVGGWCP
jgi:hypothetical protein